MNRHNIWIHIGLAAILVTLAAVVGQIDRWRSGLRTQTVQRRVTIPAPPPPTISTTDTITTNTDAEVLVRFRSGTALDAIRAIAMRNHDQVVDEIESVGGLVAIDDLDNANAEIVARQYAAMTYRLRSATKRYE